MEIKSKIKIRNGGKKSDESDRPDNSDRWDQT